MGGVIIAGLRISMEALEERTAKLPSVEIIEPQHALGRSTVESIQSGLFYSHLGAAKEICARLTRECFPNEAPLIIGTGGFSSLFAQADLFHRHEHDLVLKGLLMAYERNVKGEGSL
jgi:type III pantothenate kinase